MKKDLGTVGRWLFGLPFIVFGGSHLLQAANLQYLVPTYIPGGIIWVYITGLVFLAAGLGIVLGKKVGMLSELLALQLIIFVVLLHLPNAQANPIPFLKDLALVGAALMLAAKYGHEHRPWKNMHQGGGGQEM